MYKKAKFIFLSSLAISLITLSCGDSTESMDAFIKRTCDSDSYDCECYAGKVKNYFKSEEKFSEWKESSSDEYPDELIKLRGECSTNSEFGF